MMDGRSAAVRTYGTYRNTKHADSDVSDATLLLWPPYYWHIYE